MSLPRLTILVLFALFVVVPGSMLSHHVRERALINEDFYNYKPAPINNIDSTKSLSVLPLVNWHSKDDALAGEQGVSYLIKTDTNTILFDMGHNKEQTTPSPIEKNMKQLGVELNEIDTIFISHNHFDHVGGKKWMRENTFSLGNEQADLSGKNVYTPIPMTYPGIEPQYIPEPTVIAKGVATTGAIPRQLFIGRIEEQVLAINVEGKGIVLIVGCGHQTLTKTIERTKALFDKPIYGIIGDLHYPVPSGRINIAGINAQKIFASGDSPFRPLTQGQIDQDVELLLAEKPGIVALGGHDSSDEVIAQFNQTFKDKYQHVHVGDWIHVTTNDAVATN